MKRTKKIGTFCPGCGLGTTPEKLWAHMEKCRCCKKSKATRPDPNKTERDLLWWMNYAECCRNYANAEAKRCEMLLQRMYRLQRD